MEWEDQERVAYHEAGHAVAAVRTGCQYMNVTIKDDPISHIRGRVEYIVGRPMRHDMVIVTLAGPAAEERYEPDDYFITWVDGYCPEPGDDFTVANKILLTWDGNLASHARFGKIAAKSVADNWDHIKAVAAFLLEFETLKDGCIWDIVRHVDLGIDWRESATYQVTKDFPELM